MRNKYLSFAKNIVFSAGAVIATGAVASELTSEFTNNGKIIGAVSTIAGYLAGLAVLLPLQARDNREFYTTNGRFNWKSFAMDNVVKLGAGLLVLDTAYLVARPFMQDYFMGLGINEYRSSVICDLFFLPIHAGASVGLARATGVIRPDKNKLEDKIK